MTAAIKQLTIQPPEREVFHFTKKVSREHPTHPEITVRGALSVHKVPLPQLVDKIPGVEECIIGKGFLGVQMSWGHTGGGSQVTAYCILAYLFGTELAARAYRDFYYAKISRLPEQAELSTSEVYGWVIESVMGVSGTDQ